MKGVVFNLFEEVLSQSHGDAAWDGLLAATGLDGLYTSAGNYDDKDLVRLVSETGTTMGASPDDVLLWFGRRAIPLMARRWPGYFTPHQSTLPLLRSLNDVIHPEVRKLYAGAFCPHFHFEMAADGALLIGYRSPRQMCRLAHGFIEGVADPITRPQPSGI
jgi:hypothetical protein